MLGKARVAAIEMAGDSVRVVVIKAGGKLPVVLELLSGKAEYSAPEERFEALVRTVDEVLGRLKSRPVACVLCASSLYTIVRQLSVPFRGARRVSAAVPFELEPHLAFPLDDLLLDYNVVAEVEGETEVLAVGMRRTHLEEQLAILDRCGIEVEAVNLDAVGITGLWHAQLRQAKGLNAVLHLRSDSATLVITYNRALAYIRPLPFGVVRFLENPGAAAREIQNTIRAFLAKWRGEGEIAALHLTGIVLPEEDKRLFAESLRLPVEDVVLVDRLKGAVRSLSDAEEENGPNLWEPAIGVAAAAAGRGFALDFSRTRKDWRSNVRGMVTHVMFSACLALLVLVGVAFFFHQGASANDLEAAAYQQKIDELTAELEEIAAQGFPEGVHVELFMDPPLLDLLRELSQYMPGEKVTITGIEMRPPGARNAWITLRGEAQNAASVTEVFNNLKSSGMFVAADDPDLEVGEKTTFTIKLDRPQQEEEEATDEPTA